MLQLQGLILRKHGMRLRVSVPEGDRRDTPSNMGAGPFSYVRRGFSTLLGFLGLMVSTSLVLGLQRRCRCQDVSEAMGAGQILNKAAQTLTKPDDDPLPR